jgi:hypothetical protein
MMRDCRVFFCFMLDLPLFGILILFLIFVPGREGFAAAVCIPVLLAGFGGF